MSVVAAVGPVAAAAVAASYGQPLCGSGARKRKDAGMVQDLQDQKAGPPAGSLRGGDVAVAGLFVLETVEEGADADAERSSIGAASEGDEEEDGEEEVGSGGTSAGTKGAGAGLACMDMGALDDALPIKRGLSNFFSGKSRSFANLQDAASAVSSARSLAKPENPFNKRRRVLRCCATRWRAASASLAALPPTTAGGAGDDDDDVAGGAGRSGG